MAKIAAPPLRVENAVEPHARQHRPSWFGALRQHAYGRAAPERIAGKVIVGEAEMADEVEGVVGEDVRLVAGRIMRRSEEHTSELQSLMRISYAVFCSKKKKKTHNNT